MDLEVKWSPEATEDLESIAEYIARDSEFYARAVATEVLAVSRNICEFPLIGRVGRRSGTHVYESGLFTVTAWYTEWK